MALYSGATQRPIAPGANDPAIIPCGVILHTDAGNSKSLFGYFSTKSGGIESHFHIPKEGKPEQYRDTEREADANLKANSFIRNGKRYGFISVETQGYATDEWNPHQLEEIKKILLWAHVTHGIPLRRCPAWNEDGIGYHIMFGSPGPWTPEAKECPGPKRVAQFNSVLLPWMKTAVSAAAPPTITPEVLDMNLDDVVIGAVPAKDDQPAKPAVTVRAVLATQYWLAQQFASNGQFEDQLDRIEENTKAKP